MNILNILDSRDWDIVAYQALHMSVQLQKIGHNVILMCPDDTKLYGEAQKYKLAVRALNIRARLGFFEESLYDIIHIYDCASANVMLLKKVSASTRIFMSQIKLGGPKTLERLKVFEPYVTRFIASCPSVQDDFCRAVIASARTFVVPPAINIGRWESAMLIKPAMFLKRPYKVGVISMDHTLKEQEFFLKVAKTVLAALPETNFMVVGLRDDKIREMARGLGISHKVDVLWERNDIPEVMAMMHIFVKTSVRDGLSMALVEAQASGVACVIPRVRGLSDYTVHERNGLLVEPGNADAYVQSIIHLIENPQLCHAISKMAYDHVNFNMSVPAVANLLERLYEDSLNTPRVKPEE
ncbi:MAG: glycosyltransferase family 4 protein [Elusimicrobia bacterium]|nr:glycosyltransferase family 4 protein [Elusimicrobiota bacterium]